jgi:protein-S-isoprenylcysteine O-methyltransferase Ste14
MDSKLEEPDVAHKSKWKTFEVVFGVPFLAAIALQFIVPLSFPEGPFTPVFTIVAGIIFITVGMSLIVLARRELARHKQPTDPGYPTNKLVTTGVFSISRNPLYLGGSCVIGGIALALNLAWVLVLLSGSLIGCHLVLVVPEERYLGAKFGAEYYAYAASVYRWIGCTW